MCWCCTVCWYDTNMVWESTKVSCFELKRKFTFATTVGCLLWIRSIRSGQQISPAFCWKRVSWGNKQETIELQWNGWLQTIPGFWHIPGFWILAGGGGVILLWPRLWDIISPYYHLLPLVILYYSTTLHLRPQHISQKQCTRMITTCIPYTLMISRM